MFYGQNLNEFKLYILLFVGPQQSCSSAILFLLFAV
jgi:hypothetical protein